MSEFAELYWRGELTGVWIGPRLGPQGLAEQRLRFAMDSDLPDDYERVIGVYYYVSERRENA
jgi:hypothetical protein